MMQHLSRALVAVAAVVWAVAPVVLGDTSALETLAFYGASTIQVGDDYGPVVSSIASLNAGLWSAANTTVAEQPFIHPPHAAGLETVANFSATPACATTYTNYSIVAGVATLPTTGNATVNRGMTYGLTYPQCVSFCCASMACKAWAWYNTTDEGLICLTFAEGYVLGPQPFPAGHVIATQGGTMTVPPAAADEIANGLHSGTFLGGVGTGGYELRADGTFHLSTIRNQSPAGEPWQGVVRDAVLAVAVNGKAHVVRVRPFGNVSAVPQLVYEAAFPVAKLSFLNMSVYAYSALKPGDTNLSNTPAVMYTLHITNTRQVPLNVTFMMVRGLGLRNDFTQVSSTPAAVPAANLTDCVAKCVAETMCHAWQWYTTTRSCSMDTQVYAEGVNREGVDSGNPGRFSFTGTSAVIFTTTIVEGVTRLFNGIGSQGLFVLPGTPAGVTTAVGAANSVESLLATLSATDPAAALNSATFHNGDATDHLFAGASATATRVPVGGNVSLTLAHAWYYPHLYWFRDRFGGSDIGVRYANTYGSVSAVAATLNITSITSALAAWQRLYRGLPHPVLQDAAYNLFNHLRSSMWARNGEYRQWESLEFADWSNPTNGDERHLNYFHVLPDTMRSKLVAEAAHAQDADGMFQCVVVSAADDHQWGNGDPCGDSGPGGHPDDITMVMVGVYEAFMMRNDTALLDLLYPNLLAAFGYYRKRYNATQWQLPYQVHETYDAVPESATITGEGNLGVSLYNAVNYLTGLHCMREFARYRQDALTAAQAGQLIATVQASIERNLWQPTAGFYIGDTIGYKPLLEANGDAYHSCDGLHGQVLAYRLGFGDLLPRAHMQAHQAYVARDLMTPWGLSFDRYAQQNWLMGDHSHAALQLRWHASDGWATALRQVRYWRDLKKDASRHTAVINTRTGQYGLLNYYGYALFFYHTLSAWSGQTIHLPDRRLGFQPHPEAFAAAGNGDPTAVLPILLGGDLGTLTITGNTATAIMLFLAHPLYFTNVTICQHVFVAPAGSPFTLQLDVPLVLGLSAPCSASMQLS